MIAGVLVGDRFRGSFIHTEGLLSIVLLRQTALFLPRRRHTERRVHIVTTKHLLAAAIIVGIANGTAQAQSKDPLVGTWKLNVAKSKGAKGGTSKIEAAGAGVKFIVDLVGTDGTASHWEFTGNYDGKDNPVTGNSPYGNTAALTRVDAKTIRITSKQDGKVTVTSTIVLSDDGKTRTTTSKGTDVRGQPVDAVSVYERQ